MGVDMGGIIKEYHLKRRVVKATPVTPPVSIADEFRSNHEYQNLIGNLNADEDESTITPKKKLKIRKTAFIDSEVDIFNASRRPHTVTTRMPMPVTPLLKITSTPIPKEYRSDFALLTNNNKKKIKKGVTPKQSAESDKYPVLRNEELIQRFLKVEFTNNQKGRIRQIIRDVLRGTSATVLPDVINNKIQTILSSSDNLNDSDLRKIRVLYNMLKKAVEDLHQQSIQSVPTGDNSLETNKHIEAKKVLENKEEKANKDKSKDKKSKIKAKEDKVNSGNKVKNKEAMEVKVNKVEVVGGKVNKAKVEEVDDKLKKEKKPKVKVAKEVARRYVVFVGNLPVNVTKEQILNHFSDIRNYIKDVRIPQLNENKKSSIAYVEFDSAPAYEMALSKHHSMLGRTRINVLYTTPNKKSKITKTEAKAKSAKLTAMAKKGQLIGSIPLTKKRSHRRAKARAFQRDSERELNTVTFD